MISGIAHRVGEDVDTDQILPGRYLSLTDPAELASHVFESMDPGFVDRVKPGDLLVAGRNFGGGSSREHAPLGLKALGISCIVADSFARIFYRNAINLGLPIVICAEAAAAVKGGEHVEVDLDNGQVRVAAQAFQVSSFPPFLQELIAKGGLVPWVRGELATRAAAELLSKGTWCPPEVHPSAAMAATLTIRHGGPVTQPPRSTRPVAHGVDGPDTTAGLVSPPSGPSTQTGTAR